jgi:hypothetical protein
MLTLSDDTNLTAFNAAYRGCLEAAADSYHTFRFVPGWLADFHTVIRAALSKTIEQPTLFKDLEDALIHFTHAGYVKKGEHVDPTLRAKATTDYLKALGTESVDVMGCYRDVWHAGVVEGFHFTGGRATGGLRIGEWSGDSRWYQDSRSARFQGRRGLSRRSSCGGLLHVVRNELRGPWGRTNIQRAPIYRRSSDWRRYSTHARRSLLPALDHVEVPSSG